MKTILRLTVILLFTISSFATVHSQTMSFSAGVGSTHYFDLIKEDHLVSNYGVGSTYFIKVDFSNDASNSAFSNIAIKLENQTGYLDYSSRAMWCGLGVPPNLIFTNEKINKYTLSAISYPFQWEISNALKLRSGFALNKVFHFDAINVHNLENEVDDSIIEPRIESRTFSADAAFELQFSTIRLSNGFSLTPIYNAFISLTPEVQGAYNTLSLRHSLGISMTWGLKKK